VTATPPTPNGDFHVGHIAGPYLGADIFARYQRMRGHNVVYVCSADRNQSYVVTTAERDNVEPDQLAASCYTLMVETLKAAQVSMDIFSKVDAVHKAHVTNFFRAIDNRGHVKRKVKRLPYSKTDQRYLFESFVSGFCPVCWSATAGAICEACGHPNDAETIELMAASDSPGVIEWREREVAVLELEAFRDQFEAFYQRKRGVWRPHITEFAREMLANPLPDYPLTYVSDWGIPVPFTGLKGQVFNVWAEMLPGLMNSTAEAFEVRGGTRRDGLALWQRDSGTRLVQFLGYDNSFFFAFVHLALTWAHDDVVAPETILTNEFLELDNFKFSTSKKHLLWARDLLRDRGVNAARFYLALANPEHQKMNFTLSAMSRLVETRLTRPFAAALTGAASAIESLQCSISDWRVDSSLAARLGTVLDRFAHFHEIETFSPQRIAEHLSQLLTRIDAGSRRVIDGAMEREERLAEVCYLAGLLRIVLPVVTQPLLPDFSNWVASQLASPDPALWPIDLIGLSYKIQPQVLRRMAANGCSAPQENLRIVS